MKTINKILVVLIAATVMVSSSAVFAQTPDGAGNKTRQRVATKTDPQGAPRTTLKACEGRHQRRTKHQRRIPARKNLDTVLLADDPADRQKRRR